jgi:hypothetical protein
MTVRDISATGSAGPDTDILTSKKVHRKGILSSDVCRPGSENLPSPAKIAETTIFEDEN